MWPNAYINNNTALAKQLVENGDLVAVVHSDPEVSKHAANSVQVTWDAPAAKANQETIFQYLEDTIKDNEVFEKEGNKSVDACSDCEVAFTAEEWISYTAKQKEDVLQTYRLAFLADSWVNWCPKLGTVLANDEIVNGVSERGGFPVIIKKMTLN